MIDISCRNLTKSYVTELVLDHVNISINENEKVGLVGLNGSGKTTLLKILTKEIDFDEGSIYVNPSKQVGYLKQDISSDESLTVFDSVAEIFREIILLEEKIRYYESEMSKNSENGKVLTEILDIYAELIDDFEKKEGYSYKSKIKGVLFGLGFQEEELSLQFKKLSGGQKNRVMLAKLLLSSPEILFLDEPTNHLDIPSIEWLEKYLKEFKGTVLVIAHDRYFLDRITSKTLFVQNGNIYSYNGNYSYFIKKWSTELEIQKKKYVIQEKEIQRQKEIISKMLANGRDKKVRQAKSREKLLQNMLLVDKPQGESEKLKIQFNPSIESGRDVLLVEGLAKNYDDKKIFRQISFRVMKGDKIGLIGPNGVGKSTLIKILLKQIQEDAGEVSIGHNVKIGYFDQELVNLNLDNSVIDEIWDEYPALKTYEIRGYLAKFMFYNEDLFKLVGDLSGGEMTRLSILKLMLSHSNFLLMDEPTNHLDIDSKHILEQALADYTGTLLIISHDRYFLNKSVDKILEMHSDGIIEYLGNYDYYTYKKNLPPEEEDIEQISKTELKNQAKKQRELIRDAQAQRKKIVELEEKIETLEQLNFSLEKDLCSPEVFNNHTKAQEISQKIEAQKKELEALYEEWHILSN
ncbi:MAG: ABC-F family ATP-binding cassette domain-containing protein [Tissierellales bacterium]|nr:ABC-F family ATP-binding cassette domain-containing protein [Tissierellales bacterium]MBN2827047.1 ABC-F family ATP-binding cassette domain-containing protein [Tissierellales bacterium]